MHLSSEIYSPLLSLNPFLDEVGLLRVGGRQQIDLSPTASHKKHVPSEQTTHPHRAFASPGSCLQEASLLCCRWSQARLRGVMNCTGSDRSLSEQQALAWLMTFRPPTMWKWCSSDAVTSRGLAWKWGTLLRDEIPHNILTREVGDHLLWFLLSQKLKQLLEASWG